MKGLLGIADEYRRIGRRVIPLRANKVPLVRGYFGEHAYSEGQMHSQPWDQAEHIGLVLRPGEVALDTDCKAGKQGYAHRSALEAAYGALPATPSQRTRSGGLHELFRWERHGPAYGRAVMPDGARGDIDVITSTYRYLVLHRREWLLQDRRVPAALPSPWYAPVLKGFAGLPAKPSTVRWSLESSAELVEEVRDTRDHRNDTLSRNAFTMIVRGFGTPRLLEALREAALDAGLEVYEVDATIRSAVEAAGRSWGLSLGWMEAVTEWAEGLAGARAWELKDTAYQFAMLAAFKPAAFATRQVGMSQRDLAMRLGTGQQAAGARIRQLVDAHYLRATKESVRASKVSTLAPVYDLWTPTGAPNPLTPSVCASRVLDFGAVLGARAQLRAHPMFQRGGEAEVSDGAGWSGVLPRSTLQLLLVLQEHEPLGHHDLRELSGLSAMTVRRGSAVLVERGLARWEAEGLALVADDLHGVLDAMAEGLGVADRPHWRRTGFEVDRYRRQAKLKNYAVLRQYKEAKDAGSLARDGQGNTFDARTGEIIPMTAAKR